MNVGGAPRGLQIPRCTRAVRRARARHARRRRSSGRSTPSAPCRRGADAADAARAVEQPCADRGRARRRSASGVRPVRRGDVLDRLGDVEQVPARELPLRILRRVAAGLDAESPTRDRRRRRRAARQSRRRSRCRTRPRSCARRRLAGLLRAECCRRPPPSRTRPRRRSCRAARRRACPPRPSRRTSSPVACAASRYASDELRLVVQHLLEVRHAPVAVDRVAVKAAADVIAHAAERHRAQRVGRHQQRRLRPSPASRATCVLAEEEQQLGRTRKFRRVAEAAVAPIERALELLDRDVERVGPRRSTSARRVRHRRRR